MREDAGAGHALDRRRDAGAAGRRPHPRGPPQRCRAHHAGSSRGRRRVAAALDARGRSRRDARRAGADATTSSTCCSRARRPARRARSTRSSRAFGGSSNAFTSYDFTHYDVVVPAAHVRPAIELLADIARERQLRAGRARGGEEGRLRGDEHPARTIRTSSSPGGCRSSPTSAASLRAADPRHARSSMQALTREQLNRVLQETLRPAEHGAGRRGRRCTPRRSRARGRRHLRAAVAAATAPRAACRADPSLAARAPRRRPAPRAAGRTSAWRGGAAARVATEDIYAVDLLTYILGDWRPARGSTRRCASDQRLVPSIEASYVAARAGGPRQRSRRAWTPKNLEAARGRDPRGHPARAAPRA